MICYISSSCSKHQRLDDIAQELADLGFDHVELTGNVAFEPNMAAKIMALESQYGIDFLIHNYLPFKPKDFVLNLASADVRNHRRNMAHIKNAIRLSIGLGKDLFSIHPGFLHDLVPEQENNFFKRASDRPNDRQTFYDNLSEAIRTMVPRHFKIAVENLAPRNTCEIYSFLCSPQDISSFLEEFHDLPQIGILFDLGHLNVTARMLGFDGPAFINRIIRDHGERIFAVHVSDNDGSGDHHRMTDLDSWQLRFLMENKARLTGRRITFEWHNCASKAAFERFCVIREKLMG